ncbi:MAG: hypothetical protein GWM98_23245 [Nitrospinaceae bacterium]|nr:hypothetical protein [Nitrospinaceae bacterium]NIR56840.1 hypothetical protein [Nitrospinaceae bacterium]NIS87307.1 hypothetical protein [Nitrospinaceae bacterium]NIT84160.1 hypothetical protein [Nitrospinaceae bacterium]NIU46347.1 hypothetical protein [Nitrospinaceae bacterium]
MVKVECYSGYRVNERPMAFTIIERDYTRSLKVREVIDSWYGEDADYFKVKADDDDIYLLKYDGRQDEWDLVFYQNERRMTVVQFPAGGDPPPVQPDDTETGATDSFPIH